MTRATEALAKVVAGKEGGEVRAGQQAMCEAVEAALGGAGHLLVEAPTGTGKSLAYLVPAVLHATSGPDRRVVVVTATKALQEQLIGEDLPFLAAALAPDGVRFRFAMVKGRSNYLCRAKLAVAVVEGLEMRLDFDRGGREAATAAVKALSEWSDQTGTGDRADVPGGTADAVWSQVSVDSGECPGAANCAYGGECFAEAARHRAGGADVVVANAHLYATHLASDGAVLPDHDAVVFDEAHLLESTVSSVLGVRLAAWHLRRLASRYRGAGGFKAIADRLDGAADAVEAALEGAIDGEARRIDPCQGDLAVALAQAAAAATEAATALRDSDHHDDATAAKAAHASRLADTLRDDVARLLDSSSYSNHVAWVEPGSGRPELHLAAVDVGPLLAELLYPSATVVATSATLATAGRFDLLARRLGLDRPTPSTDDDGDDAGGGGPPPRFRALAVPSSFDHRRQALLYVARHLPDPRADGYAPAMHDELHRLVVAAGGRTLALFTSRAAMQRAATVLAERGGCHVLVQDELPRPQLLERFRAGPGSVLCATQSFWSGIDLPGRLCHLVTIDKIPFPRPTDPLTQARREAALARREDPFHAVDLPAAATQLAQGVGRLIRSATDEGVVAVFDRRLATAGYRRTLLDTLPPFRRSLDGAEAAARLERLAAAPPGRGGGT
ncbi:MAG: ATP-dependent DNA helicase [Acidimicrobiales bacterium]